MTQGHGPPGRLRLIAHKTASAANLISPASQLIFIDLMDMHTVRRMGDVMPDVVLRVCLDLTHQLLTHFMLMFAAPVPPERLLSAPPLFWYPRISA